MSGVANIRLTGTLTEPPELRYTPAGRAVLNLALGGDYRVVDERGQERLIPFYQRAVLWGGLGESLSNVLSDGDAVMVIGRVKQRSYENSEGQRRSVVEVQVDHLHRLPPPAPEDLQYDARNQPRLKGAVNEVLLVGNLTRDAELRYTPSGRAVMNLGIAVNDGWWDAKKRERVESVSFLNATVWGELAEAHGELRKGDPVSLTGAIGNDSYVDKDGNKRYQTRITANSLIALLRREPSQGSTAKNEGSGARRTAAPSSHLDIDQEFPPEEDLPF